MLIEGELSRDGTGGYRGESGNWVLRAPKDERATVYLPSAPAAFASLGAPLRSKIMVVLGLGLALFTTASAFSLPLFGADAQGSVDVIYDKQKLSSKKGEAKTYQVMQARFTAADGSEQLCPDMALHFTRDPKVGDSVVMRYLPMSPSVCTAKGPFTFGPIEFIALLLARLGLVIGLLELRSGRAKPSDRVVLARPRSKAEAREIEATLAAWRGED